MAWERSSYDDVSQEMMPGDVIAFGGKGVSSRIIKLATRSPVSHVAAILEFARPKDGDPVTGFTHPIIEPAYVDRFAGVAVGPLCDRIDTYGGEIWWLPLSEKTRQKLDIKQVTLYLLIPIVSWFGGLLIESSLDQLFG